MKRSWIFLFLLLSLALLFLLLFPLWAGRSSLDTLTFPEVAAEDIRLMELSARWEEEEYRIEDAAFFEELLSLFREIELRPLLLPPEKYPIEKAGAYWFYAELEDGRQCVFKLMGGKLLLNIVCGESPSRQHYAITKGEERLPEILALLEEYSREAESRYSITEPYAYPILPGSREWAEMDSMEERHAACQIPEEMLENMSTEALVDSIFEHPFLTNVMNENHEGYVVELERIEVFNGVQTLYQREDGIREMELKIQRIEEAIAEDSIELGKFKLLIAEAFLEKLQARAEEAEPAYSLQAIPFSLAQGLSQEQHLNILDTDGERLLYRLHEYIRDGGIHPPNNQKLGLYSLSQDEILLELEFPDAQTLQGGILLPEGFAYCRTTADSGEQEEIEYQIFRADGAGEAQLIDSGFYENGIGQPPGFARLDSGDALYSYQQRRDGSSYFGLRRLDGAGQLHSLLELEKTEHSSPIYSEISTNGREYLYFLQEEEEGLFYLGDAEHVISTASLQPGEKLLSCTLLEDGGIFLLYPEEGAQKELSYRNLQGQPTSEERDLNRLFYLNRMCSNGKDRILAVGDRFEIYNVWIGDGLIQKEKLDQSRFPAELLEQPLRFFHLSESSYLLHYQQENLFYLLSLPQ